MRIKYCERIIFSGFWKDNADVKSKTRMMVLSKEKYIEMLVCGLLISFELGRSLAGRFFKNTIETALGIETTFKCDP